MKKSPAVFLFVLIFSFIPLISFGYDAKTTHPDLTELTIDFFNFYFPKNFINETEKELIKKGSIEEDNGLRSVNHFYDPVYNKTWQFGGIEYFFPALTAKAWAQNPFIQALYDPAYLASVGLITKSPVFSQANFTWQRAIYEYVKGDRITAFESLGRILHLIQDMSVPEHTRENVHLFFIDNATSYYENYAASIEKNLYSKIYQNVKSYPPVIKPTLDDYFNEVAFYSNGYFYSPDTIVGAKYQKPEVLLPDVPEIGSDGITRFYLTGKDEEGKLFHLAKKEAAWRIQSGFNSYTLSDEQVLKDYWERLSRRTVLVGAGVVDLFFKEAEKAKAKPDFVAQNERNILTAAMAGIKDFIVNIFQKEPDYIIQDGQIVSQDDINQSTTSIFQTTTTKIPVTTTKTSASPTKSLTTTTVQKTTTTTTAKVKTTTTTVPVAKTTTTTKPFNWCVFNVNQTPWKNSVIINEIAWMGNTNNSNGEWLELKNISSQTINLSNWQLIDQGDQIKIIFPNNTQLGPGQFLLLERTNEESVPNILADLTYVGSLANQNEGLRLFDSFCQLQDEVFANPDWPTGDNDSKRTMERKADLTWQTSTLINGTPKQENSNGYVVADFGGSSGVLNTATTSTSPTTIPTTTAPSTYLSLLINEIKVAGKNDEENKIAKDEFIELYNPNNQAIDLTNWYIQKKTKEGADFNSLVTKSVLEGKIINPKSYFVIGNILSPTSSTYDAFWLESYSLTDDNTIFLKNPNGEVVDKVGYGEVSDCEGNCALNPDPGKSLQRKYIDGDFIDTDNNFNDFEIQDCPSPQDFLKECSLPVTSTTTTTKPPQFSYIKNFSWHPFEKDSSRIVVEFDVDNYPFIPETENTNNIFTAMVFYLSSDLSEATGTNNFPVSYLGDQGMWELDGSVSGLKLEYPNCQGSKRAVGSVVFTNSESWCHSPGEPRGLSYRWSELPKNNHFMIEVAGTTFSDNFSFSENDYVTIGFYGYNKSHTSYLSLVNFDKTKYYFNPNKFYSPPAKVENFEVSFSDSELIDSTTSTSPVIYFSWLPSQNDDANNPFEYEIHYVFKNPGETLENNNLVKNSWQWSELQSIKNELIFSKEENKFKISVPANNLYNFGLPVSSETTLYFAIKAKNFVGLYSPLSEIKQLIFKPPPPPPPILASYIQNPSWYFGEDEKLYLEFDLVNTGKAPENWLNPVFYLKVGWDYLEGAYFYNADGEVWNSEEKRSGGRLQGISTSYLYQGKVLPIGHYRWQIPSIYHPRFANGGILLEANKENFYSELEKLTENKNPYMIILYGVKEGSNRLSFTKDSDQNPNKIFIAN